MVNWSNMDERPDRLVPRKRRERGYWGWWIAVFVVALMFLVYALGTGGWWIG